MHSFPFTYLDIGKELFQLHNRIKIFYFTDDQRKRKFKEINKRKRRK